MSSAPEVLFATTTPGLEQALAGEVRDLGYRPRLEPGGVEWDAPPGSHQEANLWLRTANRVLLRVQTLEVRKGRGWLKDLVPAKLGPYREPAARAGLELVGGGEDNGGLALAAGRVLGLVVGTTSRRAFQLRISRGRATLSVDTSGELLYRRGYRQEISRAPIRETLAAGLLALADHRSDEPFWDGLCGLGTLAIEAALRARRHAPGIGRTFAFERWPSFDRRAWEVRREGALAGELPSAPCPIWASDLNAGALGTARRNARRAGALADLTLFRADVGKLEAPQPLKTGLWLSNLPYGVRLAGAARLPSAIAHTWRRTLPGWRLALLAVGSQPVIDAVGSVPGARFPLMNGGITVELLVWPPEV